LLYFDAYGATAKCVGATEKCAMTDDPRLASLLDELLDSQRTPEEVYSTCPELQQYTGRLQIAVNDSALTASTAAATSMTSDGTPKVSDVGLARQQESGLELTLTGAPLGTPSYMAPEQARGEKNEVGPATDIYSLGAIL